MRLIPADKLAAEQDALSTNGAPPAGWRKTDYTADAAAVGADGTRLVDYQFVTRQIGAGQVRVPANAPVIAARALPSPYAPGNFSFGGKAGLHEAEAGMIDNGAVETQQQGYGGQGYVGFGAGAAAIRWTFDTGAAGKHAFTLRYALPRGKNGDGVLTATSADGIVAARLPVHFVGGDGWQSLAVATKSAINAGHYDLRLTIADGAGLALDSVTSSD